MQPKFSPFRSLNRVQVQYATIFMIAIHGCTLIGCSWGALYEKRGIEACEYYTQELEISESTLSTIEYLEKENADPKTIEPFIQHIKETEKINIENKILFKECASKVQKEIDECQSALESNGSNELARKTCQNIAFSIAQSEDESGKSAAQELQEMIDERWKNPCIVNAASDECTERVAGEKQVEKTAEYYEEKRLAEIRAAEPTPCEVDINSEKCQQILANRRLSEIIYSGSFKDSEEGQLVEKIRKSKKEDFAKFLYGPDHNQPSITNASDQIMAMCEFITSPYSRKNDNLSEVIVLRALFYDCQLCQSYCPQATSRLTSYQTLIIESEQVCGDSGVAREDRRNVFEALNDVDCTKEQEGSWVKTTCIDKGHPGYEHDLYCEHSRRAAIDSLRHSHF